MGDRFDEGFGDEKPTHEVCAEDMYFGKYEVTVGAFRYFVEDTGYVTTAEQGKGCMTLAETVWEVSPGLYWKNPGFPQSETSPVVCVSYKDAEAFIKWKETLQKWRSQF